MLIATADADRAAFAQVYRLTSAKIFGICLHFCGTRHAAEDVMQDVYLTVWRRACDYNPDRASPITWLATIAKNRAIDSRRMLRTMQADGTKTEASDVADTRPSAADVLLMKETDQLLLRSLDELAPNERSAIRTAFFGQMTYVELAMRDGIPIGTMKSRIRRGLARLKGSMSRESED